VGRRAVADLVSVDDAVAAEPAAAGAAIERADRRAREPVSGVVAEIEAGLAAEVGAVAGFLAVLHAILAEADATRGVELAIRATAQARAFFVETAARAGLVAEVGAVTVLGRGPHAIAAMHRQADVTVAGSLTDREVAGDAVGLACALGELLRQHADR